MFQRPYFMAGCRMTTRWSNSSFSSSSMLVAPLEVICRPESLILPVTASWKISPRSIITLRPGLTCWEVGWSQLALPGVGPAESQQQRMC